MTSQHAFCGVLLGREGTQREVKFSPADPGARETRRIALVDPKTSQAMRLELRSRVALHELAPADEASAPRRKPAHPSPEWLLLYGSPAAVTSVDVLEIFNGHLPPPFDAQILRAPIVLALAGDADGEAHRDLPIAALAKHLASLSRTAHARKHEETDQAETAQRGQRRGSHCSDAPSPMVRADSDSEAAQDETDDDAEVRVADFWGRTVTYDEESSHGLLDADSDDDGDTAAHPNGDDDPFACDDADDMDAEEDDEDCDEDGDAEDGDCDCSAEPNILSLNAAAFREYLEERRQELLSEGDLPPAPLGPLCDDTYALLQLGGLSRDSGLLNEDAFYNAAGNLLGFFGWLDDDGNLAESSSDPSVVRAIFTDSPEDALERAGDLVGQGAQEAIYRLWACLLNGTLPSDSYVQSERERLQRIETATAEESRRRSVANLLQLYTHTNLQPQMPPRLVEQGVADSVEKAWLSHIAGDGACMYRSFAVGALHAFTGIDFSPGSNFGLTILNGNPDAWRTVEETGARAVAVPEVGEGGRVGTRIKNVLLNILVMWIKFYVYLVLCSDIPSQAISYATGVVGQQGVVAMTSLSEILSPEALRKVRGLDGTFHVPSLDLVVRFVVAVYADIGLTQPALRWDSVKPLFQPLLALPWGTGPFAAPDRIPQKYLVTYNVFDGEFGRFPLRAALDSSPDFTEFLAQDPTGNEASAYRNYCEATRKFARYGGEGEAMALTSVLANSPDFQPFRAAMIFVPADSGDPSAFRRYALARPVVGSTEQVNTSGQLRALWYPPSARTPPTGGKQQHYDAILTLGKEGLERDALLSFAERGGEDRYVSPVASLRRAATPPTMAPATSPGTSRPRSPVPSPTRRTGRTPPRSPAVASGSAAAQLPVGYGIASDLLRNLVGSVWPDVGVPEILSDPQFRRAFLESALELGLGTEAAQVAWSDFARRRTL